MLIGLAKGKKLYDKREDIAKRDMKREAEREFKNIRWRLFFFRMICLESGLENNWNSIIVLLKIRDFWYRISMNMSFRIHS